MATDLSLNDLRAPARLPSASTLQTLNKVLLVMLVLIAAAALYAGFVFFKVQSKLDAERRENAANAAVVATAVNDLQVIQKQFADRASQTCTSIATLSNWVYGLDSSVRESLPNSAGILTILGNVCDRPGQGYIAMDAFLTAYVPAVTARQSREYGQAARLYRQALDTRDVPNPLRVRAYEGLAYSNLKLGKLEEARTASRDGRKIAIDYVYTDVTALKLSCVEKAPAAEVMQQFSGLRAEREQIITSAKDDNLKNIAQADLGLLLNDPELASMCRYARLPLKR
jgi:hypothetical protein